MEEGSEDRPPAPEAAWRERVLSALLRTMAVTGALALVLTTPVLFSEGQVALGIGYWVAFVPFLWFAFSKRLAEPVRLAGLLTVLFATVLAIGIGERRAPEVGVYLLSVCLMAALLGGQRWAIGTGVVAALTFVALAWLHVSGVLGPAPETATDLSSVGNWITFGANWGLFAASLTVSVAYVIRHLERSLERSRTLTGQLAREVEERKREMEAREEAEARLQQAQKMEVVGRLAGGIAHDFNNLLTPILFGVDRSLSRAPDTGRADLEVAHDAAVQAAQLTRQLLALGRRDVPRPQVLDLNRLVRSGLRVARRLLPDGVQTRLELHDEPLLVRVDEVQVQLVLLNLLVNARDAMHGQGLVRIATGRRDDHACLRVEDDGEGMDEDTRARLFEPFFTTKPEGRGTGLGLATSLEMVERFDGRISVSSTPGEGSRFTVELPLAPAERRAESSEIEVARGGHERVLVIDDDLRVRAVLVGALEEAGYDVRHAGDAASALATMEADPAIDVVVCDVMLPGEDGPSLVRRLREVRGAVPVLYCTGYPTAEVFADLSGVGELEIVQKPFDRDALLRRLRDLLDRADETRAEGG
ncbi:MAG TPA: ATP-binding protein [Sandaracinaceae bacterium LLY-WYZ-13_1]|nr:ATP-binding protein [Sandaracinaceae bacterium LLY-WYZ-13_1]